MQRTTFKDQFNVNFRGDKPLPLNTDVTLVCEDDRGSRVKFSQKILDYSTYREDLRRVIDFLEAESLKSPSMPFREMEALVFVYADATSQVVAYTSNLPRSVDGDLCLSALEARSRILQELDHDRRPRLVMHIHTHPGVQYRREEERDFAITINQADYRHYQHISAFLSAYAGDSAPVIPVVGVVRPVGTPCDNAIFETEAHPHDPDGDMASRAMFAKAMRGLSL